MIKKIRLINFQSHKDSEFDLSQGLNVFTGSTNHGKSVLIRALKWVLRNEPRGEDFKSFFAKKKEAVSVSIEFSDGVTVTRERGSENCYRISTLPDPLKAIGTNVPEEVQKVLRMNSINLHSQGDPYFMFGIKAGDRAKAINKVVGLSIIDDILKLATKEVNTVKTKVKLYENDFKNTSDELTNYSHLEKAGKLIATIDRLEDCRLDLEDDIDLFSKMVDGVKKKKEEQKNLNSVLQYEEQIVHLESQVKQLAAVRSRRDSLVKIVKGIKENEETIEENSSFLQVEASVKEIEKIMQSIREMEDKKSRLTSITTNIKNKKKEQKSISKRIKTLIEKLNQIKVCPTCERPIEGGWFV